MENFLGFILVCSTICLPLWIWKKNPILYMSKLILHSTCWNRKSSIFSCFILPKKKYFYLFESIKVLAYVGKIIYFSRGYRKWFIIGFWNLKQSITQTILFCVLKIEIRLTVHDLGDSRIYVNPFQAGKIWNEGETPWIEKRRML